MHSDPIGPEGVHPPDAAQVPFDQGLGFRLDEQIDLEARGGRAHLRAFPVEDDPRPGFLLGEPPEVELHHDATLGQAFPGEEPAGLRVENQAGIQMLGGKLDPALSPRSQGCHDRSQVPSGLSEVVQEASS